jgi:hypothetical protein
LYNLLKISLWGSSVVPILAKYPGLFLSGRSKSPFQPSHQIKGENTMSRLTFRVVLSVVISLVVFAGVYASVQASSLTASQESKGMYVLSGGLINSFSQKSAVVDETASPQFEPFKAPDKGRGGCDYGMDSSDY